MTLRIGGADENSEDCVLGGGHLGLLVLTPLFFMFEERAFYIRCLCAYMQNVQVRCSLGL